MSLTELPYNCSPQIKLQSLLFLAEIPSSSEEGQGIPNEPRPDSWISLESKLPVCLFPCLLFLKSLNVRVVSYALTATKIKFLAMGGVQEIPKTL